MKMRHGLLCVLVCVLLVACCAVPTVAVPVLRVGAPAQTAELPAKKAESALAARFLNLLNHNFAYDDDFRSVDALADDAVLALLDTREGDFVCAGAVADYLLNFYGIEATDFSGLHPEYPQQDGFVYIVPRGYALYSHSSPKLSANEDGSYTVVTTVRVTAHDGVSTTTATSLLVPDARSQFGWVIIRSTLAQDRPTA